MSITCSCGHQVSSGNECIPVEYPDYMDMDFDSPMAGFVSGQVTAIYCQKCAAEGKKAGVLRIIETS